MSVDSRMLKRLYRVLTETEEDLERTSRSITSRLEETRLDWNDEKRRAFEAIVDECQAEIRDTIRHLQYMRRYIRDLYHIVKRYEEIGYSSAAPAASVTSSHSTRAPAAPAAPAPPPKSSSARCVPSIEEIQSWIGAIDPLYKGDPFDPYSMNCGSCALCVFRKLEGSPLEQASPRTYTIEEMERETGRVQVPMTPDQIRSYLISRGPGAHAVVGIDRDGMPGHWCNAYYDGKEVYVLDGQTGKIGRWPPYEPNAIHWDIGI